jgi:hypothetical protein
MAMYHIRIIGGWCGNRMVMIRDFLSEMLADCGYQVKVTHQSVWETYALPPSANLILQLIPAFKPEDTPCPIVNIKPFIRDLDHLETISAIIDVLEIDYPQKTGLPAGHRPDLLAQRERHGTAVL